MPRNKQPFIYGAEISFILTEEISESRLWNLLDSFFGKHFKKVYVPSSVTVGGFDVEAGDPDDLM